MSGVHKTNVWFSSNHVSVNMDWMKVCVIQSKKRVMINVGVDDDIAGSGSCGVLYPKYKKIGKYNYILSPK